MKFLPVAEPDLSQLETDYVMDAMKSGWISSLGAYIERFEVDFASLCGTKHAVSVSNGTVGLHLVLVALGIQPGDEVVVPSLSFVATAAAVRHAGAIPVFVDCDPFLGNMDPAALENAITTKTKAVIVVHLYGHPCEMNSINEIAREHQIAVVEDAAEAHGAQYHNRVVGSLSKAGVFSFYGNKILTTGEGGAITTDDSDLNQRLRFLRDHAMDPKQRYWHPEVGYNYRITNLQAAMGVAQIERFDEIMAKRRNVLEQYRNSGIDEKFGVQFNPFVDHCLPAPWLVCCWLPSDLVRHREEICLSLRKKGIDTRPFFHPIHLMPPYQHFEKVAADRTDELRNTEVVSLQGFNLPSSPSLNAEEISYICKNLHQQLEQCVLKSLTQ